MSLLLREARLPDRDGTFDLLVVDGAIRAIAPAGRLSDRDAEPLSLDGRWVVPGLWDNHVHFSQWARTARRLELSDAGSATHAARLVETAAAAVPGDGPLVGFGHRAARWPDEPTRDLLDRAAGSRPVVLISADLHSCWLNTAAVARFAPDATEAILREGEAFAVIAALSGVDDSTLDSWAAEAAARAAARGVVGIVDLEMTWNLDVWTRRIAAGLDSLRVEFGTYTPELGRLIDLGFRSGDVVDGSNGLLTVGPFKIITDGSLGTRTAYCFDPYPGETDHPFGLLTVPTDQLIGLMTIAAEAGLVPAVHAIGDHANRLALDAFEAVGTTGRIEHAQLLADADVARFAELGVVASVQPEHVVDDRDIADVLWAGRTERVYPFADLHGAGVRLALGSDAPVAPLDPWQAIASAVARTRDGREAWHPENALSREVALASSARTTVAEGQVADLAIVDLDPLACTLSELRRMPVAATLLGGRFTHDTLR